MKENEADYYFKEARLLENQLKETIKIYEFASKQVETRAMFYRNINRAAMAACAFNLAVAAMWVIEIFSGNIC